MNHYFSEKPEIKSEKRIIKYTIQNKKFEFITDNGVFSKSKVDFGTDLMLNEFLKKNRNLKSEGIKILDIGCGYGVVSVILKSFYPKASVTLSDVNERALELSEENLKKYNINGYEIIKSNAFEKIEGTFDVILSNPPIRAGKDTIFKIYTEAYEHLNKDGEFYCVTSVR